MNQCCVSVDLVAFGWRFFVTNPDDVVLSVWIGGFGCLWPIYSTVVCAGIYFCVLIYSASIYVSAAEVIQILMICAMFKTTPLFSGFATLFDMKKCPPDLIPFFGSVR